MNDAVTSPDEVTAALEALHAATPDHAAEEADGGEVLDGDALDEAAPEEDGAPDASDADGAGAAPVDEAAADDLEAGGAVPDAALPADAAIAASALAIATLADRIGVALPEAVVPGEPVEGIGSAADGGAEPADDADGTPSDAPAEDGGAETGEAEIAVAGESAEPTGLVGVSDAAVAAAALGVVAAATRAAVLPASADSPEDAADAPEGGAPSRADAELADPAVGAATAVATGAATAAAGAAVAATRPSPTRTGTATPETATEGAGAKADADAGGAADRPDEDEGAGRAAVLLGLAKGSVRNPRRLMIAATALVAAAWLGGAIWTTQALADGSTVGGVSVGGMSPSEARSAVEQFFAESLAQPVTVTAGDKSAQITPADSGVSVDAGSSVGRLTGFTLNPLTIIDRLGGDSVPAATSVDSAALTRSLNSHLGELSSGTVNAEISLQGTKPVVSPSRAGTGVDVEASVSGLSSDWPLGDSTIALVEGTTSPAVTDEQAQSYADSVITPLLSAPVTVTADGATTAAPATGALTLSPQRLAPMLRISSKTGELSTTLDPDALRQAVVAAMGSQIERAAVESGWTIEGRADARPRYVAPVNGLAIDTTALSTEIITTGSTQVGTSQRQVVLPMTSTAPSTTTAEADWGIKEIVGEYATPYYEDPARTQNLIAGAAALNGKIVMPGATFSTNDSLEPVDAEHGFTSSGVILDGVHTEAFGGGLSQIGTTVFNAAYEAGMDDVEHHPHSYWFDRYPAGREATLWSPEKDVKFSNSTPYPALIQAWAADGQVHVRLWSTHHYDVSIVSGEKEGYTPIGTVNRSGPRCEPYGGGEGGFSITVTRSRKAPDGTVTEDTLRTTYDPDNAVTCSGGGAPAQPSSAQAGQPQGPGDSSQTSAQGQQAPSGGSSPDPAAAAPEPQAPAAPAEPQAQAAPPVDAPAAPPAPEAKAGFGRQD
ncbi:VanW family protein [Actinomyces timonensis]|uniref:VanW family protein n=1 Tax=Actinomyces timonensis TaxID=1288391 RepID=A0AAU8MYZ1_9ACTO